MAKARKEDMPTLEEFGKKALEDLQWIEHMRENLRIRENLGVLEKEVVKSWKKAKALIEEHDAIAQSLKALYEEGISDSNKDEADRIFERMVHFDEWTTLCYELEALREDIAEIGKKY